MRDYRKLQAFQLANQLALAVYACTKEFPREELFGLTSQMRRAAVSIGSNIALGSSLELEYQITLSSQLGYLHDPQEDNLKTLSTRTSKTLYGLIKTYRKSDHA
ncbi:hypothetical protein BMS3Bbin04_00945 [bacterium BMS3Bbin04]|nr:hypothetical protein BMS3Bbin04_00945 [bacterium BMS3Bbin04]